MSSAREVKDAPIPGGEAAEVFITYWQRKSFPEAGTQDYAPGRPPPGQIEFLYQNHRLVSNKFGFETLYPWKAWPPDGLEFPQRPAVHLEGFQGRYFRGVLF